MFSGIIQEVGKISKINQTKSKELSIKCTNEFLKNVKIGDSISINGACQTVTQKTDTTFTFFSSADTLSITNLSSLQIGSYVNLESPISVSTLLHGHLVMGHVDNIANVQKIDIYEGSHRFIIKMPLELMKYTIKKGSIAINGISLTILDKILPDLIIFVVIPHTLNNTNLKHANIGSELNVEVDMISKYIENMLVNEQQKESNVKNNNMLEKLKEHGFY